ncbi:hypothetical protein [Actinokineospora alba]|uniref:hypothetical protein n=1 Tax=Actinokineospora alba TaxID=504798 RepID=UPI0010604875|nr:hypothetical protein [Actinokineospora alba]TDP68788.1 hypothetical protein C8E96_4354 [Actinokineospora alba]
MEYTLVVYNRAEGRLVKESTFARRSDAMAARFEAEQANSDSTGNIEIVVLGARSREDLMQTHSRYFVSLSELSKGQESS